MGQLLRFIKIFPLSFLFSCTSLVKSTHMPPPSHAKTHLLPSIQFLLSRPNCFSFSLVYPSLSNSSSLLPSVPHSAVQWWWADTQLKSNHHKMDTTETLNFQVIDLSDPATRPLKVVTISLSPERTCLYEPISDVVRGLHRVGWEAAGPSGI